ncbi:hypothetical protein ACJIZ3_014857 [Penstemon smallii]|uniref:At2g35280-like TPR domain-containing protein n=1 Tax=Penstemon smallii TaxID=265156 RepID=A0ABD3RKX9_9LAMI
MFKQAVKNYFIDKKIEAAYKCLQRAVNLGHLGAMYVTCIVLLLSGDDKSKKEGIKFLGRMKKSKNLRSKVLICREKLIKNLSSVWVENQDLRIPVCCTLQNNHKRRSSWSDIEESVQCEACSADNEIREIRDYISMH